MEVHILVLKYSRKRTEISSLARRWAMERLREKVGEEITWGVDEWGKPFCLSHPGCHFNIAHSGELVLFACDERPVGLDVERIVSRDFLALAGRFYHPHERLWVGTDESRFYEVWTAKEAYLKAKGIGIRVRLSSFSVIKDGKIASPESDWFLVPFFLGERFLTYRACLCAQKKEISSVVMWEEKEKKQWVASKVSERDVR
ncbi:MAG: 4'-phosphopantetheinyl transferase family protein [Brevinematales bacterium]